MSKIYVELIYRLKTSCQARKFGYWYRPKYKIKEKCCDKFVQACKSKYIGFDDETYSTTFFPFNIRKGVSYPEDYWDDYTPIDYCPFCSEKIEIELYENHDTLTKKIQKHKNRKFSFLKGLNQIILIIVIHGLNDKKEDHDFIYKYGLDKIIWRS
jgi:hypothetical protein